MISETTERQLRGLQLATHRPLVICDVDEVVVHFTRDFERYLNDRGLWLDAASLALHGNIRWRDGGHPAEDTLVSGLIDSFFADRTRHMEPIDGAIESLLTIATGADVVMLTNLPHTSGDDRRANLGELGLPFPVITNSGPKGPAIKHLAAQMAGPVVFIDDSPYFISSSYEHAPDVHLIHFMHDERFSRHVPKADYVSLRTHTWEEAKPHVLEIVGG
jgi:FMN phosphatase YigB (HAD superfamily)